LQCLIKRHFVIGAFSRKKEQLIPFVTAIRLGGQGELYWGGVVYFSAQPLDIPIYRNQTQIYNAHISPNTFHFLCIPQWICIIVAVSEHDRIRIK
jgi:hypothetical protein